MKSTHLSDEMLAAGEGAAAHLNQLLALGEDLEVALERVIAQSEMLHALLDEKVSELITQVGRVADALTAGG